MTPLKAFKEMVEVLEKHGFEVEAEPKLKWAKLKLVGTVNPADVRTKVATVLSVNGFQGYYLKEVYAYRGSKNPWRTDEEGYVELEAWFDLKKVEPTTTNGLKIADNLTVERKSSIN